MTTRDRRLGQGRRRGRALVQRLVAEIATTRRTAGISQDQLASALGWSQSHMSRLERLIQIDDVSVVQLAELAGVLGLELGAGLHPIGDGLVDRGHQALLRRFRKLMSPSIQVTSEVPLLRASLRSWDLMLRTAGRLIGVEAETRVRDAQELVRRIRIRERDGGADWILLVLSDSRHNRQVVTELRQMLGPV